MNNIFVNIFGWLKDSWVTILVAAVLTVLAIYLTGQNSSAAFVSILALPVLALLLSYEAWTDKVQQAQREEQVRTALTESYEIQLKSLTAEYHEKQTANVSLLTHNSDLQNRLTVQQQQFDQKTTQYNQLVSTVNELDNRNRRLIADHTAELADKFVQSNMLHGALTVLASVYPSGIRRENYLDRLTTFLYVDLPGEQTRFEVAEYNKPAEHLDADEKSFVAFLNTLPTYEKAWDGHLPNMVPERLAKLGEQVHELRQTPVLTLTSTGKAPPKPRVAKKRARVQQQP